MPREMQTGSDRGEITVGVRQRIADLKGRRYWRSLEELADTEEFREYLHREFPEQAAEWTDPVTRRSFIRVMGASLALAGISGACTRQPRETIVPYNTAPEQIVPGLPLYFATTMPLAGYGAGLLAESHMGRPTKIEGNPDHPASLGASSALMQASVLGLYDPDRSQTLLNRGEIRPWADFVTALKPVVEGALASRGAGLRILTGTITSPTLGAQLGRILEAMPEARRIVHEPARSGHAIEGARLAYGRPLSTHYRLSEAARILSLDCDFLGTGSEQVRAIRDYTRGRRLPEIGEMNRLYVIESTPSITGARADHRLAVRSSEIAELARGLAAALGVVPGRPSGAHAEWIRAVAEDLHAHQGASAILAGEGQPPGLHALVHLINHSLGNVGAAVRLTEPVELILPGDGGIERLASEIDRGEVSLLLILGQNPVYSAPADLDFAAKMARVGLCIHLGLHPDETARASHWHIPEAHYLESWGDVRSADGTASIIQPLIEPLYGGKTANEILSILEGKATRSTYEAVRAHWAPSMAPDFERRWARALNDGIVQGSAFERISTGPDGSWSPPAERPAREGEMELVFREDPSVFDGSFANNGWLQELPRPLTKITWENAALVSPATAAAAGLSSGDEVELAAGERTVRAPVWITPGHADGSVTVHLGYGRTRAGRVGDGAGFNAYALRASNAPWIAPGLTMTRTGEHHPFASTQMHQSMEGRHLVRSADLEHYRAEPGFAKHLGHEPEPGMTLYPPHPYESYAWGMSVDLNACVGCNACVAGCVSENNIPVVGRTEVMRGRAMHWMRVDLYFEGEPEDPATLHQPVMCQHCENAPCELVCPVGATVHSSEGLNEMVYNRCVGTRYCANNCPYKVRRFNFFYYNDDQTPSLKLMRNPDVSVRSRGVMEKCSYCVQRINLARIDAKKEDRKVRDGEIVTACQQACPADAIVFGDINDPGSRVSGMKSDPRSYGILTELNTRPRTTYLASIRNPNPAIDDGRGPGSAAEPGGHHG